MPGHNGKSDKPNGSRGRSRIPVLIISVVLIIILAAVIAAFTQGFIGVPNSGAKTGGISDPGEIFSTTQPTGIPTAATPVPTPKTPRPTPTPTPTPTPAPASAPLPADSADYYYRTYEWSYDNAEWTYSLTIPRDVYDYYRNRPHNRESDYSQYALSDYDRAYIQGMVDKFKETGQKEGYGEYDTVMMIISFVQSLPYTSDSVTTGYDEYPRYPLETLVDHGGDCEDTAILTAALLQEMDYGSVLIELPEHMAVGVKCSDDFYGTYYEYGGSRYYYLETTGAGWDIGEIPEEYAGKDAIIRPMIQAPRMSMSMHAEYEDYDAGSVYYRVHCDIENIGSGTAYNPVVSIAARALTKGPDQVWSQETVVLEDYREGASGWAEATVSIPRDSVSQIQCVLYGSNFETVEINSERFST